MATNVEVFSYDGGLIRAGYEYDNVSGRVLTVWCENRTSLTVSLNASGQTFVFPVSGSSPVIDRYVTRETVDGEEVVTFPLSVRAA